MKTFSINAISSRLQKDLQHKIDNKTKPLGSLGKLETIALRIGLIQDKLTPQLNNPHIVVFAGDHGIVKEGVSAYPQEVTHQMVLNFMNEGAAINIFCRQNNIALNVVDAGVNHDFGARNGFIHAKVAKGTKSFLHEKAMSEEECQAAIQKGAEIVDTIHARGCNVIGFGEMGIGNTASASMIMHYICQLPLEQCIGRGAGLNGDQLQNKMDILKRSVLHHKLPTATDPLRILSTFGGYEIAMICGAILQAASLNMVIMIDGFIATSAFLIAYKLYPHVIDYSFFCHCSNEKGHEAMLNFLEVEPILRLDMRLGEGTGAAVAYPILKSAVCFLNEMASFQSASVSTKL
jgi:nicotinate-nucleotide--dimethylbenzimidazole phosphoribosyltransferase